MGYNESTDDILILSREQLSFILECLLSICRNFTNVQMLLNCFCKKLWFLANLEPETKAIY